MYRPTHAHVLYLIKYMYFKVRRKATERQKIKTDTKPTAKVILTITKRTPN